MGPFQGDLATWPRQILLAFGYVSKIAGPLCPFVFQAHRAQKNHTVPPRVFWKDATVQLKSHQPRPALSTGVGRQTSDVAGQVRRLGDQGLGGHQGAGGLRHAARTERNSPGGAGRSENEREPMGIKSDLATGAGSSWSIHSRWSLFRLLLEFG